MYQASLTQMAQAKKVAVATPSKGRRATADGTGSEKATECKYSTMQQGKELQGAKASLCVGFESVEAERNRLLRECQRLEQANESLRAKFDYVMQSYCQAVVAVEMARKGHDASKLDNVGSCPVIPITPSRGKASTGNKPCAYYSLRG